MQREKKIEIILKTTDEKVRISVFNTGKHISEEFKDRIWESFYKADKARSREYGGVGLTLEKFIWEYRDNFYL